MVAAAARLRSTIVAYWVSDTETFVWVVSPDGRLASARIDVTAAELVSMVRDATGGGQVPAGLLVGAGRGARPWRALYRLLLGPVRAAPAVGPWQPAHHRSAWAAVRSAVRRAPRSRRIVISSSPTTSTTFPRSARCRTRRRAARRRAASSSALLVGDPSPDAPATASWRCRRCPGRGVRSRRIAGLLERPRHGSDRPGRHGGTRARRASPASRCCTSPRTGSSRTRSALSSYLALAGGSQPPGHIGGRRAPTAVSPRMKPTTSRSTPISSC